MEISLKFQFIWLLLYFRVEDIFRVSDSIGIDIIVIDMLMFLLFKWIL